MPQNNNDNYEIIKELGVLEEYPSGWRKEINYIKWFDNVPKIDIRSWAPGREESGKGVTLSIKEIQELVKILTSLEKNPLHDILPKESNNIKEVNRSRELEASDRGTEIDWCRKCMLYVADDCIGTDGLCEFFRPSPYISDEEMELWPREMGGAYGTLHRDRE